MFDETWHVFVEIDIPKALKYRVWESVARYLIVHAFAQFLSVSESVSISLYMCINMFMFMNV
jgi:hypothetical protein